MALVYASANRDESRLPRARALRPEPPEHQPPPRLRRRASPLRRSAPRDADAARDARGAARPHVVDRARRRGDDDRLAGVGDAQRPGAARGVSADFDPLAEDFARDPHAVWARLRVGVPGGARRALGLLGAHALRRHRRGELAAGRLHELAGDRRAEEPGLGPAGAAPLRPAGAPALPPAAQPRVRRGAPARARAARCASSRSELLEPFVAAGGGEFVSAFSSPYAGLVFTDLLHLPRELARELNASGERFEHAQAHFDVETAERENQHLYAECRKIVAARKADAARPGRGPRQRAARGADRRRAARRRVRRRQPPAAADRRARRPDRPPRERRRPPRPRSRAPGGASRRPGADPGRARGAAPALRAQPGLRPHGDARRRGPRPHDPRGRDGRARAAVGEPRPRGLRRARGASGSAARRTRTSPSATARTSAPAPPWRGRSSGSRSRSCSRGRRRSSGRASPRCSAGRSTGPRRCRCSPA